MRIQQGFTLIELVIVIVILGILSVTAMPKFIDLSSDAKREVLANLAGSIKTAAEHSMLKARINGVETNRRSSPDNLPVVMTNLGPLELKYGYPEARAEDNDEALDILDLIDIDDEFEVCYSDSCQPGNSSRVKIGFDTTEGTGCYVRYSEPGGTGAPSETEYAVIIVDEGC